MDRSPRARTDHGLRPARSRAGRDQSGQSDGYFQARAIFNERFGAANGAERASRNVLLLLDTSLSMSGEKLIARRRGD